MKRELAVVAAVVAMTWSGGAQSAELMLGAYAHNVDRYIADRHSGFESGADIMVGLRSDRIGALRLIGAPQAYGFVSLNTNSTTNFVAAGLSWPIRLNERFYFRPGLGLAYTDGKADLPPANAPGLTPEEIQRRLHLRQIHIEFGSQLLFQPELNLGVRIDDRWKTELSWVHLSNGEILHHGRNQGLDDVGVRVIYALGASRR